MLRHVLYPELLEVVEVLVEMHELILIVKDVQHLRVDHGKRIKVVVEAVHLAVDKRK
ncbi:MAG: hypothetical protein KAQ85_07700 [Thermodesulfovibrionia bacterium]|nr:hypothetical protein [Thermodesulfovibrionia bacterium]